MDWFEKLMGFQESGYEETRARLEVEGEILRSRINGANYGIGEVGLVSLQALRERAKSASQPARPDQDECGDRRCTTHASGPRKCRRTVPGSLTVQSAGDGFAAMSHPNRRDPISMRCTQGQLVPSQQAQRPSTVITSFRSRTVRARPRRGNSMVSPILARH